MPQNPFISLQPVKVKGKSEISPGAYLLSFTRQFEFKAGQVIAIGMNKNDDARVYSIASGTNEKFIEILFDVKPSGYLTPQLRDCKPGDDIYVSEPFGAFLGAEEPAYWLAAGTGIAPFRSMLRSGFQKNKKLFHGVRTLENCYFAEEMEDGLGDNYLKCVSQEQSAQTPKGVYYGRITNYFRQLKEIPPDHHFYLCGSAEFVIETREILFEKGLKYEKVVAEIYF